MERTRTFVSTARMLLADILGDGLVHLVDRYWLRLPSFEQRPMDILGCELTAPSNDNFVAFELPFQKRTGADAELSAHLSRNGDLALRRNPGASDAHVFTLPW